MHEQCIRQFTERLLKFPPCRPDQIVRCELLISSLTRAKTAGLKHIRITVFALDNQFCGAQCPVERLSPDCSKKSVCTHLNLQHWITILLSSFLLQVTTAVLSITNKIKSRAKKSETSDEKMDVVRSLSYCYFVVRRFVFFTSFLFSMPFSVVFP